MLTAAAPRPLNGLHKALVATWLLTALCSALTISSHGARLLHDGGITDPARQHGIVVAGAVLDAVMGFCLWHRPGRWVYRLALLQVLAMTGIATVLLPSLWLDPLGCLLKNLPIVAALAALQAEGDPASCTRTSS